MTVNVWKSYMWTVDKDVNMTGIFTVMNSRAVMKIRPEKIQVCTWFEPMTNIMTKRIISIGSTNYPQIDIFLCSYYLSGWYCREKFCLGHLWELKGKLKSIMFPQGPPGKYRGKLCSCLRGQFHQKKKIFLQSCVTFANKLGILRGDLVV